MTKVIVVGVDGTETAQRAAESAAHLATALGTALHVVTAFSGDRVEVLGMGNDELAFSEERHAENVARVSVAAVRRAAFRWSTSQSAARPRRP